MTGEKLQAFVESTTGQVIIVVVIVALFLLILISGRKKKTDTKTMAVCALLTAMAIALSYIKVFTMPQGGSITLFSMVPIVLAGYFYGTRRGLMVGAAVGLLNLLFGPYVIHPAQMLLDYPIAFGALAIGAPLRDKCGKMSLTATYLVGENVDVKTAQDHFGHRKSATTLEIYAESVPAHEREVARTMDSFVKAALGGKAPEEQSLEAFRDAITTLPPDEWPAWVRELAELVNGRLRSS